jgi:GrpB-like predicted nucleotidyltransferase (UPF0157 family)
MRPLRRAAAGILPRTSDAAAVSIWYVGPPAEGRTTMTDEADARTQPGTPSDTPTGRAPMSEEQIRKIVVGDVETSSGPIEPLNRKIVLHEDDPEWPRLYAREEARIRAILGDRVVSIEHTGSTSVPDLAAKPIIDITMTVADVTDEDAYVPDLAAAGYVLRIRETEPEWYDHRVCKGPDTNINLHTFSSGCPEVARMVGFRDWLRTHAADRKRYEATKRELAKHEWKFVQNYADAKSEVVDDIARRAGLPGPHP